MLFELNLNKQVLKISEHICNDQSVRKQNISFKTLVPVMAKLLV